MQNEILMSRICRREPEGRIKGYTGNRCDINSLYLAFSQSGVLLLSLFFHLNIALLKTQGSTPLNYTVTLLCGSEFCPARSHSPPATVDLPKHWGSACPSHCHPLHHQAQITSCLQTLEKSEVQLILFLPQDQQAFLGQSQPHVCCQLRLLINTMLIAVKFFLGYAFCFDRSMDLFGEGSSCTCCHPPTEPN